MRRVLFLVTERTGSTFFTSLLIGKSWRAGRFKIEYPVWLPTVPEKSCKLFGSDAEHEVIEDCIRERPVIDSPEAYLWNPPAILSPIFYDELPGDFRFVYLFRDPRGKVESTCARAVRDFGSDNYRDDPRWRELFRLTSGVVAEEMRSVLKMIDDPRFLLVRFEDLISDPVATMGKTFDFVGLKADSRVLKEVAAEQPVRFINSSFSDRGKGSAGRWSEWTSDEREAFDALCGDELIRLGYESDNKWVDEAPKVRSKRCVLAEPEDSPKAKPAKTVPKKKTSKKAPPKKPAKKSRRKPAKK